jgi:hypothetical protein
MTPQSDLTSSTAVSFRTPTNNAMDDTDFSPVPITLTKLSFEIDRVRTSPNCAANGVRQELATLCETPAHRLDSHAIYSLQSAATSSSAGQTQQAMQGGGSTATFCSTSASVAPCTTARSQQPIIVTNESDDTISLSSEFHMHSEPLEVEDMSESAEDCSYAAKRRCVSGTTSTTLPAPFSLTDIVDLQEYYSDSSVADTDDLDEQTATASPVRFLAFFGNFK